MAHAQSPIAILGCGTMGEAIVAGLLASKARTPAQLLVTSRREARRETLASRYGVLAMEDNAAAIDGASIVLLCLKPRGALDLLDDPAMVAALHGKVIVSIAAGVPLAELRARCPDAACIRAMPNTPCTAGKGMTVLARAPEVTDAQLDAVRDIFCAVGRIHGRSSRI